MLDAHYGGPRPRNSARAVRLKTAPEKAFCALGPAAEAFLIGARGGSSRLGTELGQRLALQPRPSAAAQAARIERTSGAVPTRLHDAPRRSLRGALPHQRWSNLLRAFNGGIASLEPNDGTDCLARQWWCTRVQEPDGEVRPLAGLEYRVI